MNDDQPQQFRRWHDDQGDLSTLIDLLGSIPEALRPIITEALTLRADQQFEVSALMSGLKALGTEKIMALHNSRKKRRSYDQDPNLHKIADTFLVIPEAERVQFAGQFLEFTSLMVDYMATCETFNLEPQEEELSRMRDLFVEQGEEAVRTYLQKIHQPYDDVVLAEPVIAMTDDGLLLRRPEVDTP